MRDKKNAKIENSVNRSGLPSSKQGPDTVENLNRIENPISNS